MTMPDGTSPPPPGPPPSGPPVGYPPQGPSQPYVPAGPTGYSQPPMTPPKRNRRGGLVALGVLVVLIIVIVGALAYFRDSISGDVNALVVGDCIDDPASSTAISDVQHQPCAQPHDGEVYAVLVYPGADSDPYPGNSAFTDFVRQQCLPAVQTYTGRTSDEIDAAGLVTAYFYPVAAAWTEDKNHGVTCYLEKDDGSKLTGSVKAAAPSSP